MKIIIRRYSCFRTWEWAIVSGGPGVVVCVSKTKFADKSQARDSAKRFCKSLGVKLEIEKKTLDKPEKPVI